MERVKLSENLEFSRLIYGMWRLADDPNTSESHVETKINKCLDQGITTFDQADIYGGYTAEAVLGKALKKNPALRNKIEIITKCDIVIDAGRHSGARVKHYNTSREHIHASVDSSLTEMGTDYIDLLLIHRPDPFMNHHLTGAALDELVASGKVGSIGVSNFRPWDWDLLQSAMNNRLITNQIEISLQELGAFTNGDLAFHQKHGHNLMAWSPLGGGDLISGKGRIQKVLDELAQKNKVDRAAIAVAFLLTHPAKILPILGTNNIERISLISDATKVDLDRQDWFKLYEAGLGKEVA